MRGPHVRLPLFLGLGVVAVVLLAYASLAQLPTFVLVSAAVLATVLGAVLGLAVRDSQERVVSVGHSLWEGFRRLGHALWY
jgi:tetrahydromethanopterin S-methyltransferase subunit C